MKIDWDVPIEMDDGLVLRADVFIYLRNTPKAAFDYIHIAPPQYHNLWAETLAAIDARPDWVNPDGVVVAQIDPLEFSELLRSVW